MYFIVKKQTLNTPSESDITEAYSKGFLFTRTGKNKLIETISLRIKLQEFKQSSENRRILNKGANITLSTETLPYNKYSWRIHALGKKYYQAITGTSSFSASRIKTLFTDVSQSNFNFIFTFSNTITPNENIGYVLCYKDSSIIHYSYPFYNLENPLKKDLGLIMINKAINWAVNNNIKYFYLGSVTSPKAFYKLQFNALEWWDYQNLVWSSDLKKLKELVNGLQPGQDLLSAAQQIP